MPTILHPMERVFSGVQSSGAPHVGKLLPAAFRQWVVDQHTGDSVFCVVDLHALTVEQTPPSFAAARSRPLVALRERLDPRSAPCSPRAMCTSTPG